MLRKVPPLIQSYLENWAKLSTLRTVEQVRQMGRILNAFENESMDYFLMKGAALSLLYYPTEMDRPMQDLDIMIKIDDALKSQQIMFNLGFTHGIWKSSDASLTPRKSNITKKSLLEKHELPPFTKISETLSPLPREVVPDAWRLQHIKCAINDKGVLKIPVFVDLHINLSVGLSIDDIWRGAEVRNIFGRQIVIQSPTSMLWFIASRLYIEAFHYNTLKLSMFGDVCAILHKQFDNIDWAELLSMAYKYGLRPALYYVLMLAKNIADVQIPLEVLAILKPTHKEMPLDNDWGDLLPKIFSRSVLHEVSIG